MEGPCGGKRSVATGRTKEEKQFQKQFLGHPGRGEGQAGKAGVWREERRDRLH